MSSLSHIMQNKMVRDRWLNYLGRLLIIALALFFAFFPIVWIASASFDETGTLNTQRLIPRARGLGNYDELLSSNIHPFGTWMELDQKFRSRPS